MGKITTPNRGRVRGGLLLIACGLLGYGLQAGAASSWLYTGAAFSEQGGRYEYLGLMAPLFSSTYLTQRYLISDYYYRYGLNGVSVKVRGQAAEAELGVKTGWDSGWAGAFAGPRYRDNRVSPDGADPRADGTELGAVVGLEGEQRFGPLWALNGTAAYTFGPDSYWGRLRLLRQVLDGKAWVGIEGVAQGDPSYHAHQGGLVVDKIKLTDTLFLGFNAGVKKSSGESRAFYGGFNLAVGF
ncbi:cellulose biosynthesis protein BcsS [Crenobacter sp. SG2305]|uniref:cellulose biosynthesis protein BcsS n=1 Tax=Crenobacter oryzisoli TaxID=3056844 RepID=UPI0025AA6D80|nr:cellulose biosynthesis protein BcsS [Crenobacter sp. SG2305]MDN0084097.1 cellulose biosynthesis protein BcsS [Crenobacter sp. SG2305]